MNFNFTWEDRINGLSDAVADDVNSLADGILELQYFISKEHDDPISPQVAEALAQKAEKANFYVGEGVTTDAETCYAATQNIREINNNNVNDIGGGMYGATYYAKESILLHVTADHFVALGLGANDPFEGMVIAVHCDNTQGMQTNMNAPVKNAAGEDIGSMIFQLGAGECLLFRYEGDAFYVKGKGCVTFSDGNYTAALPTLSENRTMGDMIWRSADEFLQKIDIYHYSDVTGTFPLQAHKRYAVTLAGDTVFSPPDVSDVTSDSLIEVILHLPLEYAVSFGNVLYWDGKKPILSVGCYRLLYAYDVNVGRWCLLCTEYREDWSEALGLSVDFKNCVFERLEAAKGMTKGTDFDAFSMYGGRKMCNVADDGTILAYEGDTSYANDGGNGQVMVYQPAFYYKVIPLKLEATENGTAIRKAEYYVSEKPLIGFKRHPAFYDENGDEIDYILLSAYEGCIYDADGGDDGTGAYIVGTAGTLAYAPNYVDLSVDKLSSVGGVMPCNGLTLSEAEQLAQNRGTNWHIDHMLSLSVNQLLAVIEMGGFNMQTAIGEGVWKGGEMTTLTGKGNVSGQKKVTYRGCENLWGNVGQYIGGFGIDTEQRVYIAAGYDYHNDLAFPWRATDVFIEKRGQYYISAFLYDIQLDWAFLPCEVLGDSITVGDAFPVQDTETTSGLTLTGIYNNYSTPQGLFGYNFRGRGNTSKTYGTTGARLLYIPTAETEAEE